MEEKWNKAKEKTVIQSLAEFFGWNRELAAKVKITETEIAPNGTRRERRINNNFVPSDEDINNNNYITQINFNIKNNKQGENKMNKNEAKNVKIGSFLKVKNADIIGEVVGIKENENKTFEFSIKNSTGDISAYNNSKLEFYNREISVQNFSENPLNVIKPSIGKDNNPMMNCPASKKYPVKSLNVNTFEKDKFDSLKFANKSNLSVDKAYIIHCEDNPDYNFICGVYDSNYAVGIQARNINSAKKIYNLILDRTYCMINNK